MEMAKNAEPNNIDRMFRETTVASVDELLQTLDRCGGHVFRGQPNAEWKLETTFERAAKGVSPGHWRKLELKVMTEFKRRAQHYLSDLPRARLHLEWLALMQHHGSPTRLLDFTRSSYVSLFFAVEDSDSASAVWAVDATFYESRPGVPSSDDHLHSTYNGYAEKEANDTLSPSNQQDCKSDVLLVEPYRMNERLSIQQGLFLFPKNLKGPFEENLCNRHGAKSLDELAQKTGTPVIVKIIIPKKLHLQLVILLSTMNISAATLFPGLDGYARSQKIHIQSAKLSIQQRWSLAKAFHEYAMRKTAGIRACSQLKP